MIASVLEQRVDYTSNKACSGKEIYSWKPYPFMEILSNRKETIHISIRELFIYWALYCAYLSAVLFVFIEFSTQKIPWIYFG